MDIIPILEYALKNLIREFLSNATHPFFIAMLTIIYEIQYSGPAIAELVIISSGSGYERP